jgi:hypothetical protein
VGGVGAVDDVEGPVAPVEPGGTDEDVDPGTDDPPTRSNWQFEVV